MLQSLESSLPAQIILVLGISAPDYENENDLVGALPRREMVMPGATA